jgi:hypothetical protein
MSEHIYGQFIEHLGRCIYGGIWAEMLEDRKFFHPITAEYNPYRSLRDTAFPVVGASPWEIMGDPKSVSMRTEEPFVGRHTPLVDPGTAGCGSVTWASRGQRYVGYVWLKRRERPSHRGGVARDGDSALPKTIVPNRARRRELEMNIGGSPLSGWRRHDRQAMLEVKVLKAGSCWGPSP